MNDSSMSDAPPSPTGLKTTPMFEQYLGIKKNYPDALLFYRMGDFYELFFDDAATAAAELQIALTSRNPRDENPTPMCGVPYHALDSYLPVLLEKGYKVAICDQVSNPRESKGLVQREVTRVLTPGTVVEESGLESGSRYLGALFWDSAKSQGAFAWLDYSTGQWSGLFGKKDVELWQWVQKLDPRELLLPDLPPREFRIPESLSFGNIQKVRLPVGPYFGLKSAEERLLKNQGVQEAGALDLDGKPELIMACGAILAYLAQTQKEAATHLKPFAPLNLGKHLIIDEITERNLELFRRLDGRKGPGTLKQVLNKTVTPMGDRLLDERLRHPWRDLALIENTRSAVEHLLNQPGKRASLRQALKQVNDLERLSTRITLNRATPRDFAALRQSLLALPGLRRLIEYSLSEPGNYATSDQAEGLDLPPALYGLTQNWDDLADYAELLDHALLPELPNLITEGGLFKQGYHKDLDELLDLAEHGEQRLKDLLAREQAGPGLTKLKLGFNKVFGYYFELSRAAQVEIPAHFHRRQTVANAERFVTPELKELEDKLLSASDKRKQLEYSLFQDLRLKISRIRSRLVFMAELVAALDYWQSLAECAQLNGWAKPSLHEERDLLIRDGRHPVVEAMQQKGGFIPNDLRMDAQRRLILITGPNMAGKSTVLRQTAIICLLAQMGSYVPAREASIGMVDRIFSRVGASDNLAQGQSTFMVEMMETARILRQASKMSLVILDEIGRGTSTFDGLALAWAVVEDLAARAGGQVRTLFATHYHELTSLEGRIPGLHNMNIAVREWNGEIVFLRRLVPGPADRSYGIEVAKLAGVPQPVVQRARQILAELEKSRNAGPGLPEDARAPQLLPGISGPEPGAKSKIRPLLPERQSIPDHPLLTALKNLDANAITPLDALKLLSEWKLLWGTDAHG